MRRQVLIAALLGVLAGGVPAEETGDLARAAAADLATAAESLLAAGTASDRIAALTSTVRAYEDGLAAMRQGLRQAALRERELDAKLSGDDAELGRLLVLLETASKRSESEAVLHPGGALELIRAGTLTAALVPALHARTAALEDAIGELDALILLQEAGMATLEKGLGEARAARLALAEALSERADLPPRVATDDAAMEALVNSSETLAGFADSLLPDEAAGTALPERAWLMPVRGPVLRSYNDADAAGIRRPGWVIATDAEALVTAPASATVRFADAMPGQGVVAILEPQAGALVILAGLGQSFLRRGQIVAAGEPIGLMGGRFDPSQEKLNETSRDSGHFAGETLYMEIRRDRSPVDPADVLQLGQ